MADQYFDKSDDFSNFEFERFPGPVTYEDVSDISEMLTDALGMIPGELSNTWREWTVPANGYNDWTGSTSTLPRQVDAASLVANNSVLTENTGAWANCSFSSAITNFTPMTSMDCNYPNTTPIENTPVLTENQKGRGDKKETSRVENNSVLMENTGAWANCSFSSAITNSTRMTLMDCNYPNTTPIENTHVLTENQEGRKCAVCEESATGRHYGVIACDGCKGFFRRSIRRSNDYHCRFNRSCRILGEDRNVCRYCRLSKCLQAGMKISAIQKERDQIRPVPAVFGLPSHKTYSIRSLLQIELSTRVSGPQNLVAVNVLELFETMKIQLPEFVRWAKLLPMFAELSRNDQMALLRDNVGEHFLLKLAHQSMHLREILLLRNNFALFKTHILNAAGTDALGVAVSRFVAEIFDQLLNPLQELNVDDTEIACLKPIFFFNPGAFDLSSISLTRVRALQNEMQKNLADHLFRNIGRCGALLLLLPVIQSLSTTMMEQINNLQIPIYSLLEQLI